MEQNGVPVLKELLQRLEKVTEEVLRNQGFTEDTEKLLILFELVKEQVPRENTGP